MLGIESPDGQQVTVVAVHHAKANIVSWRNSSWWIESRGPCSEEREKESNQNVEGINETKNNVDDDTNCKSCALSKATRAPKMSWKRQNKSAKHRGRKYTWTWLDQWKRSILTSRNTLSLIWIMKVDTKYWAFSFRNRRKRVRISKLSRNRKISLILEFRRHHYLTTKQWNR